MAHQYGFGTNQSYFRDLIDVELQTLDRSKGAAERLKRHAEDMFTTDEARAVRAVMQTRSRNLSNENRAVSTASNSDGVFVTPNYLLSDADYSHSYPASAIGQVVSVPDEGYGLQLNIPLIGAITSVDQQVTENTGIEDTSPGSGGYVTSPVITLAGQVPVSLQLYERSGPQSAMTIDRIIQLALHNALVAEVDAYLLAQMQTIGNSTTAANSYTNATFYEDVANAQAAILTGTNVRLPATHAFCTPTLATWLLSQSTTGGLPLLTTHLQSAPTAVKLSGISGVATGYTGTDLLGSHFFSDGNIADVPNTSPAQAPIVFCNAGEVFLMQSEPVMRIISEGVDDSGQGAPTLTVLLQYFSYVGVVIRHGAAVNTLSGESLVAAPSFT